MLTIGLTGGIACGKSYTSSHLALLGAHCIDADVLARQVVAPGLPTLCEITDTFGPEVISPDGTLDRKALGRIVFSDASRLKNLNRIIHPYIFKEQAKQIEAIVVSSEDPGKLTFVVDAALMIEAGSYNKYDLIIVAYCPERIQLERLAARNGFSEKQARQRIRLQMPLLEKISYADFVIDTSGHRDETKRHIEHLWKTIQLTRGDRETGALLS